MRQLYRTIGRNSFIETEDETNDKLLSDSNFWLSLLSGSKHCPPTKNDIKIDTEGDEGSNVLEGQWKVEDTDTNFRLYDGDSAMKQRWEDRCESFSKIGLQSCTEILTVTTP